MWISRAVGKMLESWQTAARVLSENLARAEAERDALRLESTRQQGTIDWMKHRLNQVERERAQLIAAAIGVKIAVPEFVPTAVDPASLDKTMNAMQEIFKGVGEDSADDKDDEATSSPGVDYRNMPGYRRQD
jgi:hypothetical protein